MDVISQSHTVANFTHSWIEHNQENNRDYKGCKYRINHPYFRKFTIMFVAILFGIHGIVILDTVVSHFNYAVPYCNKLVTQHNEYYDKLYTNQSEMILDEDLFAARPELFFWNHCLFKVYPFDTTCDCRIFQYDYYEQEVTNDPLEAKQVFNIDILNGLKRVMTQFRMMEKFELEEPRIMFAEFNDSYWDSMGITPRLNLTDDVFNSGKLQIFNILQTPTTTYLSEKIGELQFLQYLSIVDTEIVNYPPSIGKLSNLQYLWLRRNELVTRLNQFQHYVN